MIEILDIQNENILGFSFNGEIKKSDIQRVWRVFEEKLESQEKLRFYVEGGDFRLTDISMDALVEDLRLWLKHPGLITKLERAAFVSDQKWLRTLADVEFSLIPTLSGGTFPFEEKQRAMDWLKSDEPEPDEVNIKWAELIEVGLLRSLAGIGIGLLAADLIKGKSRRALGLSLFFGSVAVGVPIALKVLKKNRRSLYR